jgi:lipoprotein NlpI/transglutaminase-like putative cysteine protease
MYLAKLFRAGVVLAAILSGCEASAQQNTDNQLKEVQLGSGAFTLADPVPSWVDPSPIPEATKPQPIVVRLADTQYLVGQTPATYVRRATLINDAASLTAAGRFSISFAPEYERVQLHAIRIYRGQDQLDRTTTSNIRFLQREQGLEQGVYSGRVTASILVDDLRVGDTIDISYSTYGQNPVFGGKYFGVSVWDQGLPTLHRRVVLNYPVNRSIVWRMIGDREAPPLTPRDTVRDGMHRVEFDQQPLPEIVGEALVSPDFFGFRFLQFSEFANWNDVAKWATTLFETKAAVGDELQSVVKRIRALDSDQARVSAALEFVQSQIRYFSVSLGESSHRPALPDEVLRRRYGDCKDKSFLLVTLLRELGIESRPILLQIGRRAGLEKTLPSPQFFDHVIVRVSLGGKTFFLDPTRLGQHGLLDQMGQAHEGAEVLVVASDTRELSTISSDHADTVGDEITERATLSKLGDEGKLETRRVWNGLAAERLRVLFERTPRDQVLRGIGNAMERRYPGARLVGEPAIHDDPVQNVFSIAATYKVPKLASDRDGNWVVFFKPDNMQDVVVTSPSATRATPLRIPGFPYHGKYSFEMTFPEEVSVVADPRAQTTANNYFSATVSEYFRGNIARKTVDLATLRSSVEAKNYPGYAEDLRTVNKAIGGVFVVPKSSIKSTEASASLDFQHRLEDLRQETIKKATETIAGGKLSGSDLADVYCLRGNAYSDLERYEEALQDTNNSVRLAPNASGPLSCRAEVYFRLGQFEKSIADYSKAISLGATDALSFRGRGISRFFAGHLEDASTDFVKASELADQETKIYCDIWLASAFGRLKKTLPDDVARRAAADARGEWPRAGLAMLTGAISPDDLLKTLEEKKGDERDMALAEAYFYLGEHYLVAGDNKTAQSYFEKTRGLGVIIYTEHIAAGLELARLKADGSAASAAPAAAAAAH